MRIRLSNFIPGIYCHKKFILLFFVIAPLFSAPISDFKSYRKVADSLFARTDEQVNVIKQADPGTYFACACRTLPFSIARIQDAIGSYERYSEIFSFCKEIAVLSPTRDTAYVEIGAGPFRTWSLLKYDSTSTDSVLGRESRHYSKDKNILKNLRQREKSKGRYIYELREFGFIWQIQPVSPESTRVTYITFLDPDFYFPGWMFKSGCKIIVPGFLDDLEKALKNKWR